MVGVMMGRLLQLRRGRRRSGGGVRQVGHGGDDVRQVLLVVRGRLRQLEVRLRLVRGDCRRMLRRAAAKDRLGLPEQVHGSHSHVCVLATPGATAAASAYWSARSNDTVAALEEAQDVLGVSPVVVVLLLWLTEVQRRAD